MHLSHVNNVGGCQGLDGLSSLDGLMISDTRCWWGIGTVFPIPRLINSFLWGWMCLEFSLIELLFLRRQVETSVKESQRLILKYQRFSDNRYDAVFEEKKAIAESELSVMRSLLSRLNDEIAFRSLLSGGAAN